MYQIFSITSFKMPPWSDNARITCFCIIFRRLISDISPNAFVLVHQSSYRKTALRSLFRDLERSRFIFIHLQLHPSSVFVLGQLFSQGVDLDQPIDSGAVYSVVQYLRGNRQKDYHKKKRLGRQCYHFRDVSGERNSFFGHFITILGTFWYL